MRMITKEQLEALRSRYPAGTRVELLQMDDVQAPPIGTKGTVTGVDDTGSLMVNWDNGSGLNVIYGIDHVRKVVLDALNGLAYEDDRQVVAELKKLREEDVKLCKGCIVLHRREGQEAEDGQKERNEKV